MDFIKQFKDARRVSVPLVCVRTADAASTKRVLSQSLNGKTDDTPLFQWNVIHGITPINNLAKSFSIPPNTGNPIAALKFAETLKDSILFMENMHRFWNDPQIIQAIWNLRDTFKAEGSMLAMTTTLGAILPVELADSVLVIDEPLPTEEYLKYIIAEIYKAKEITAPDAATETKALDALIGLSAFPAEQALAMQLTKSKGLDCEGLWERKRQAIEQVPGLAVWRGGETFDAIGGCDNAKNYLSKLIKGKNGFRVVVFIDEIEKAFAGSGTDSSGVKTGMTGTMLTWMQDKKAKGIICIGPPGAAKSAIAKATGNTAGVPTIALDFEAMQNSLVGASGERLRAALNVIEAISQGKALFIATCNRIASLPPELRRRFKRGTFFFDLPNAEERDSIWKIYENKFQIKGDPRPNDTDWTGAEIEQCCETADDLGITLKEAAAYVVPVAKSAAEDIKSLREQASGKFISAGQAGIYQLTDDKPRHVRKMRAETHKEEE